VHVYKKKKRKRYSKLYGHRSHITALRILEVRQPDAEAAAAALEAAAAAEALPSSSVATRQLDARAAVAVPDDGGDADAGQQQQQQQQDEQPTRLPLHLLPGRQHGPPAVTWAPGSSPSSSSPSS
jgi:large subunit ribosomal protein L21